jgi:hypothetical protein
MSKLVTGLMFSTLAFAAATFYLSYQLGVEREKNLRLAGTPVALPLRAAAVAPTAPVPDEQGATAVKPAELNQIIARLAEQATQGMQRRFECQRDPACDLGALNNMPGMSLEDWIATALGPERYALYQQYHAAAEEQR